MYNLQPEIKGLLNNMPVETSQGISGLIENVPLITYEETGTTEDTSQLLQYNRWTFNIFTKTTAERTKLKVDLYRLMIQAGWRCDISQALNDPSGYSRQLMIFSKTYNRLNGMTYSGR